MTAVSIILPVLDESPGIVATLAALERFRNDPLISVEIIVADGGSRDDTVALAAASGVQVITAPRGRARQMNAGAAVASGEILLFLHADTVLPTDALAEISRASAAGHHWGRFDVAIEGRSFWFPIIAGLMNRRSRWTGIATGDQAIFVRRSTFEAAGRFPDLPLMEDIALSSVLRASDRPYCSRSTVRTSGRRWEKQGVARTILLMWQLRLRYFFGADPARLARDYGYGTADAAIERIGIAILAKAPIPGYAKTRLIPRLGAERAARLQDWLLRRTVTTALAADCGPVTLWCAPDTAHPVFQALAATGRLELRAQPEGDLGQRMLLAARTHPGTLIVGTDCPLLDAATLRSAAQALRQGRDAVLVPAEDGGYVLIGLRAAPAAVFSGVEWGSAGVLEATRQRLREQGLDWSELPTRWDVDRPADLDRLEDALPEVRTLLQG